MVCMEYESQHLPKTSPSFVGKYTSTMGCIWVGKILGDTR